MNISTTRRNFLGAAGAAGFAAAFPTSASAKIEQTPWGIKLGLATYTFRNFDRAKTIEFIKAVQTPWVSVKQEGVKGKFHWDMKAPAEEQAKAKQDFAAAGLKVMSAGNTDMKALTADGLRPLFLWAKAAGIPMLVAAPVHDNIGVIEGLIKEYDIKVAIHNHGPEDKNFPTPQSVLDVVKNMDPRMGLCIDCGHTSRTGVDVVESIRVAGPRLHSMHVKDLADAKVKESQCDVGDGVLPMVAIFKQLHRMNYTGGVMLEYEINESDPMLGMQKSLAYMRGVMAGLRG